jgi:hypothetical protein
MAAQYHLSGGYARYRDAGVPACVSNFAAQPRIGGHVFDSSSPFTSASNRPKLDRFDRLFWVVLRRLWTQWSEALIIGKPDIVVSWQRTGFRLFCRWQYPSCPILLMVVLTHLLGFRE